VFCSCTRESEPAVRQWPDYGSRTILYLCSHRTIHRGDQRYRYSPTRPCPTLSLCCSSWEQFAPLLFHDCLFTSCPGNCQSGHSTSWPTTCIVSDPYTSQHTGTYLQFCIQGLLMPLTLSPKLNGLAGSADDSQTCAQLRHHLGLVGRNRPRTLLAGLPSSTTVVDILCLGITRLVSDDCVQDAILDCGLGCEIPVPPAVLGHLKTARGPSHALLNAARGKDSLCPRQQDRSN
jgi:hypothetical protein